MKNTYLPQPLFLINANIVIFGHIFKNNMTNYFSIKICILQICSQRTNEINFAN